MVEEGKLDATESIDDTTQEEGRVEDMASEEGADDLRRDGEVRDDSEDSRQPERIGPEGYHGLYVTPENRARLVQLFGKDVVNMSIKGYKAWRQGKTFFMYKGQFFPVMGKAYMDYLIRKQDELPRLENKNEEE